MPQGEVRGRQAELVDHAFDGREDSGSGHLRGGLGQLVDGVYGEGDGKEDGYEWVGWKRKYSSSSSVTSTSPPVSLVFAFDSIRSFDRVDIFADNHFTKDVQVFKEAKIYFSNEEDKFGDDRRVDFSYMPDASIQLARNVSIRLHGQHGKYVMVQLYFAAKWIVISEVTFISGSW